MNQPEIINLFLLAIANSFIIIGWNRATYFDWDEKVLKPYAGADRYLYKSAKSAIIDKMVFWKLRYLAEKKVGLFWSKPLFTCCTCMASVHSTYVFWLAMPLTISSLIVYPLYVLFLSGLVTFINNRIE